MKPQPEHQDGEVFPATTPLICPGKTTLGWLRRSGLELGSFCGLLFRADRSTRALDSQFIRQALGCHPADAITLVNGFSAFLQETFNSSNRFSSARHSAVNTTHCENSWNSLRATVSLATPRVHFSDKVRLSRHNRQVLQRPARFCLLKSSLLVRNRGVARPSGMVDQWPSWVQKHGMSYQPMDLESFLHSVQRVARMTMAIAFRHRTVIPFPKTFKCPFACSTLS